MTTLFIVAAVVVAAVGVTLAIMWLMGKIGTAFDVDEDQS